MVPGERLPDPQLQRPLVAETLEDAQRPEPAVLVVHCHDAARQRERDRLAARADHLVLGRADVGVAEVPGALLTKDAGRLAVGVPLDHAAGHLEVRIGEGERRGVDPQRVIVLRHQRDRHVADDGVERLLRRLDGRRPLAVPPAEPSQPAPLRDVTDGRGHARECVVERVGALEPHLALRERPGGEMDVRVGEAGEDAPAAEVDPLRAGQRGLVRPDAAGNPVARDRERRRARQRGVERADDTVLEDHVGDDSPSNTPDAPTDGRVSIGASVRSRAAVIRSPRASGSVIPRTCPGSARRWRRRACRPS